MAADTRGLVSRQYPPFLRDLVVAGQLLRRDGLAATVAHATIIVLRRLHSVVFDRPLLAGLPHPLLRQSLLGGLKLRTCRAAEAAAGAPCSPIPCKTLHWAIRGTGIDPASWHFIDIGSGTGWALQLALRHPFRAFTGVEFAYELHQKARANIAWLTAQKQTQNRPVHLRHESALATELPSGPCVLLMFCPFDERIMQPFVRRIERSVAENPRPIIVLYVNPAHPELFVRSGVSEITMMPYYRMLIRYLSPYAVRAFRFGQTRPSRNVRDRSALPPIAAVSCDAANGREVPLHKSGHQRHHVGSRLGRSRHQTACCQIQVMSERLVSWLRLDQCERDGRARSPICEAQQSPHCLRQCETPIEIGDLGVAASTGKGRG